MTPILLPAYSVQCTRCERWIEYRCDCRPRTPDDGYVYPDHSVKCKGLPERCPKCKAGKWLEAPRWRRPDRWR